MNTKTSKLQIDLINGPIFKSLIIFALPLFISNFFQQCYNTADTMIVGHFLGDTSLGAVGACSPVYELLIGFAVGIGNGLAIVTARLYGAGNRKIFKRSVASSILIALGIAAIITIISQLFVYPLLKILNTSDNLIGESYRYISTITAFTIITVAYNLCSGLLRSIGNSVMPLVFLVVSSLANIGLDLLFIAGLGMGVEGAAIATVLSQGLSVVLCLIYISLFVKDLIPSREDFTYDKKLCTELFSQGFSMAFMSAIVSAGSVVLQYGINGLENDMIVAGHTAARKLFLFSIMPLSALGMSSSTFMSQNRGAGKRDRIIKCIKGIYLYVFVISIAIWIFMLIFAEPLIRLVSGSTDPTILKNGSMFLKCNPPFYIPLGIVFATRYSLQSLGMKMIPVISSVIEFVGKIIFVLIFIPMFGYMAVIFCEPVIWCFMALYLAVAFFQNPYIKHGDCSDSNTSKK